MGDDDVTNCCHGDLVFEITSNGKGKGASRVDGRGENGNEKGKGRLRSTNVECGKSERGEVTL